MKSSFFIRLIKIYPSAHDSVELFRKNALRIGRYLKRMLHNCHKLAFLNDSSGWLSIWNLSQWSGGNWPALLVLHRLPLVLGCGRCSPALQRIVPSQILQDDSVINSKTKTKKIDSIDRKEKKLKKQIVHTFLHLRFVKLKLRIDFLWRITYVINLELQYRN